MRRRREVGDQSPKRRTTLTLPADSLSKAARIARSRNTTLSSVIAEALADGLELYAASKRGEQVLQAYGQAFNGFTDEEMMALDGVILEPLLAR